MVEQLAVKQRSLQRKLWSENWVNCPDKYNCKLNLMLSGSRIYFGTGNLSVKTKVIRSQGPKYFGQGSETRRNP